MERWGRLCWYLGLSIWLGSMFLLFAGITPNVFRVLTEAEATRLVDAIFPVYYAVGLVFGGLMLLGAILRLLAGRLANRWVLVAVGIVNWVLVLWADRLLPTMNRLSGTSAAFKALHHLSVVLGALTFLVTLFGLVWDVWRT